MLFYINELLASVSFILDDTEKEVLGDVENHSRRVACIAARIGGKLQLSPSHLADLISFSLLHDNGVSKALMSPSGLQERTVREFKRAHCIEGESNLAGFPFYSRVPNVILYHHEHYNGTGVFGAVGKDIPLYSRIIGLADYVDNCFSAGHKSDRILTSVSEESGKWFDPECVAALMELGRNAEFWMKLDNRFVERTARALIRECDRQAEIGDARIISQILSRIIDAQSPFTGIHSRSISEKVARLCRYYGMDGETCQKMQIASDLHDLGKLMIPKTLLEKPSNLTMEEYAVVQTHPFYTYMALESVSGFEEIAEWAANHHEKLNGRGYPRGLSAKQLDFNARILCCVDIYQALTEDRPYRGGLCHEKAVEVMREMVAGCFIEGSIVEDINSIFADEQAAHMAETAGAAEKAPPEKRKRRASGHAGHTTPV